MKGVPGFTAETAFGSSLHEARYACTPLGDSTVHTNRVYPQSCAFLTALSCAVEIASCTAQCGANPGCIIGCLTAAAPRCVVCVT